MSVYNASLIKRIQEKLKTVYFGFSPESDQYIDKIILYSKNTKKEYIYKNSTKIIEDVLLGKLNNSEVDVDKLDVQFSKKLYKDVQKEYEKLAVGIDK